MYTLLFILLNCTVLKIRQDKWAIDKAVYLGEPGRSKRTVRYADVRK